LVYRYRHDNIIQLCGYSMDGAQLCLVYQFMENGSLENRLMCKVCTVLQAACLSLVGKRHTKVDYNMCLVNLLHFSDSHKVLRSSHSKQLVAPQMKRNTSKCGFSGNHQNLESTP